MSDDGIEAEDNNDEDDNDEGNGEDDDDEGADLVIDLIGDNDGACSIVIIRRNPVVSVIFVCVTPDDDFQKVEYEDRRSKVWQAFFAFNRLSISFDFCCHPFLSFSGRTTNGLHATLTIVLNTTRKDIVISPILQLLYQMVTLHQ